MGRRSGLVLRRAGVALASLAIVLSLFAIGAAVPTPPQAVLEVDDRTPFVGETVRFDASASAGHDEGNGRIVAYRFEFGDGAGTAWQEAPFAQYAYASAGPRTARVTVRDARGLEGQASLALNVLSMPPTTGEAPDLMPLDGSTRPIRPEVDTPVFVVVTILNRGGTAAETASIDVTDARPGGASVLIETLSLDGPLSPGATVLLFSAAFLAEDVGEHTIHIEVRDVQPTETFTEDNVRSIPMVVVAAGEDGRPSGSVFADPVVLLLLAAAVGAFFGALVLLSRPTERRPLGPPPAEPPGREPPPVWPP